MDRRGHLRVTVVGGWTGADPRYRGYRPRVGRAPLLDHRVRVAQRLMPFEARVVVDLGAGDGYLLSALAPRARLAVAVDLGTPEPLAPRARTISQIVAPLPGPLPFAEGTVDVVVCLEAIEHLLDPDALLEEVSRVLAPGGVLILSTPRLDSLLVVVALLAGIQPPGVESSSRRRYGTPVGEQRASGHVHLFTRRALEEALSHNGFRVTGFGQGRFSSSWWQAVRSSRRPGFADWMVRAALAVYDLVPVRKDVLVVRAERDEPGSG